MTMQNGREIERRWLIAPDALPAEIYNREPDRIQQGYLTPRGWMPTVRVRIVERGKRKFAYQTIKSVPVDAVDAEGVDELEFGLAPNVAHAMLKVAPAKLRKDRFVQPLPSKLKWEFDVFKDALDGLIIAEIEVPSLATPIEVPAYFGPEITGLRSLSNVMLAYEPAQALAEARSLLRGLSG